MYSLFLRLFINISIMNLMNRNGFGGEIRLFKLMEGCFLNAEFLFGLLLRYRFLLPPLLLTMGTFIIPCHLFDP